MCVRFLLFSFPKSQSPCGSPRRGSDGFRRGPNAALHWSCGQIPENNQDVVCQIRRRHAGEGEEEEEEEGGPTIRFLKVGDFEWLNRPIGRPGFPWLSGRQRHRGLVDRCAKKGKNPTKKKTGGGDRIRKRTNQSMNEMWCDVMWCIVCVEWIASVCVCVRVLLRLV